MFIEIRVNYLSAVEYIIFLASFATSNTMLWCFIRVNIKTSTKRLTTLVSLNL